MKKYRRFTAEQSKVVQTYINLFSHNILQGCELCSIELQRDPEDIRQHWYRKLRKEEKIFTTGNPTSAYFNTKNVQRRKPRPEYKVSGNTVNLMCGTVIFKK
jgi:hypothetical protein